MQILVALLLCILVWPVLGSVLLCLGIFGLLPVLAISGAWSAIPGRTRNWLVTPYQFSKNPVRCAFEIGLFIVGWSIIVFMFICAVRS